MKTLQGLLGIELPIIQAPMAGVQGSALAVAVANAGGLGSLPCAMLSPDALRKELASVTSQIGGQPLNVNFFCHTPPRPNPEREAAWRNLLAPYYKELGIDFSNIPAGPGRAPFSHDMADVLAEFRPAVVSFHFGLPSADLLQRVRTWNAVVLSSATTVDEARWLAAHGADAIIAQGLEAGGHRGHFLSTDLTRQMGTFALVPQIAREVNVPVIAAGG
ncbi:MAG TPA: nitronate monooxygenase, partial [Alphaproteobacteria bacterium]|nr:nitronate monooxygenase [Alphaproteobacteria bacterium]